MSGHFHAKTTLGRVVNEIEETAIAILLGLMTLVTFINVVLRYGFNTGLIWGLEVTTFLFAWLVLFGVSYAVKTTAHLGVDAVINAVSPHMARLLGILASLVCLAYAFLLTKGAWDYWANFANLPQTEGRWFPLGFQDMGPRDYRGWYETIDVPIPNWLRFIEPIMLFEGDPPYEKLPRFIPYAILPFGMALLLFRFAQATLRLIRGEVKSLIVSHEAEDAIEDVKHLNSED